MKILVLGAGFLGTEIVSLAIEKNIEILPTRLSGSPIQVEDREVQTLKIDVLDPKTFDQIPEDISHVIYSISARDGSDTSYENAYFKGIENLVNHFETNGTANKIGFVFISSTGVFSENEGGLVNEESSVFENDKKYSHLLQGEDLVKNRFGERGLVLRLSGIYGKGRRYFVKLAEVLSENLNKTKPEEIKVNWTNRIHKTDAARACFYLLEKKRSGTYIVSDDYPSVNIEAIKFIQRKLQIRVLDLEIDELKILPGKRCDNSKLKSDGFQFEYPSFAEGYGEMLDGGASQ